MKHIPVFLAANELYTPFIATTMASILDHTQAYIDFYILSDDMNERNKYKLSLLKQVYPNHSIEYLYINTEKYLKDFPNVSYYSIACYNRFLIPQLKPNLKKVIYSDVDVIYMDDIQKMYDIELGDYGLAAPIEEIGLPLPDGYSHKIRKEKLSIPDKHLFFQSGNLIINCDYWRQHKIMEKCFETTLKNQKNLLCPDLDVLNIVFQNNYKKLDYRFSVCTHRIRPEEQNKEMIEAVKNPFCIHYSSSKKPWKYRDVPFSEQFWHYARQTPFYEDILIGYIFFSQKRNILEIVESQKTYKKLKIKYIFYKILSLITFGKTRKKLTLYKDEIKREAKRNRIK